MRRFARNRRGLVGGVVVAVMVAAGALAPVLAPQSYSAQSLLNRLKPPSAAHWLGTDGFGRDILSRVIWGCRVSLEIGFLATGLAVVVGAVVGSVSANFGGAADTLVMRVADMFMSVPALFLILVIVALFGASLLHTALVIALITWAPVARVVRAECLALRARDFVSAAHALGAGHVRVLGHHLFRNALPVITVQASLLLGQAI
ncbi:MAG TPA: ABC transporter permease, partial [Methylomirabilota bacterium]|nr:ABC transporter permease [Methylomirabilota bacterium]